MFAIFLILKMTKNPFTMSLKEYYENCTHEQLVKKLLEKKHKNWSCGKVLNYFRNGK